MRNIFRGRLGRRGADRFTLAAFCAVLWLTTLPEPSRAQSAEVVFQQAAPSVFVVESSQGDGRRTQGSAVVVAPDLLATNCHTIGQGQTATLRRGRVAVAANVVHRDRWKDICIIAPQVPLGAPTAILGSVATLRVGAPVFAIGAPLGLELSLSAGLVSQLRTDPGPMHLPTIQITAPISPGSSGGGLFDAEGRLVGITTSQARAGQNLNFAVPSDVVAEALASVQAVNACLAGPNRACLIDVAQTWTLYGEHQGDEGFGRSPGPGFGVLLNIGVALRAEGQAERANALIDYWRSAGGRGGRAVVLAEPSAAVGFHTLMAASILDTGNRRSADAELALALRAQEQLPAEHCPTAALLRLVLELRGRPAMDLVMRSHSCDAGARGPARELREHWTAALPLLAAGREAEGRIEALEALRAAVRALRPSVPGQSMLNVLSDVTGVMRFAARSGDRELTTAAAAVTDAYEQALRRQPPRARDDLTVAVEQTYLLRLLALSGRMERARSLALAENTPERRANALSDLFSLACLLDQEAICSAKWLEGADGRGLPHPASPASTLAWARAVLARALLGRGRADEALDLARSLQSGDLRDQALACVAAYWGQRGEFDRALAALAGMKGDDVRAEFLLLALARQPVDARLPELSMARLDAYGLRPCWRMLR